MRRNGARMNLGEHLKIMKQRIFFCVEEDHEVSHNFTKQAAFACPGKNNVKNTKYQILLSYDKLMKIQFNNTVNNFYVCSNLVSVFSEYYRCGGFRKKKKNWSVKFER